MTIDKTALSFLQEDCIQEFGEQEGTEIFQQTAEQYRELLEQADYRGSDVIKEHLQQKLYPPMAYYKTLRNRGITQDEALILVKRETHKAALIKKGKMQKLAKLPFAYPIYRMGVKRFMKKNFPDEGWETQWVQCSAKEIHFNLRKCIYWELSQKHGCPELCCVYCENDDISFSGLLPKIRFLRTGTLGTGANDCDFHFYNR